MCGIAFISPNPDSDLPIRALTRSLLNNLTPRGRDAAGVAWKRQDGTTLYRKLPGHPARLAQQIGDPVGSRSLDAAGGVLIHTRFATVGTPYHSANNHPIIRPGVAMVHNGSIRNVGKLYNLADALPEAAVDSDALAALIENAPDDATLHKWFGLVRGLASIAWFDVTDDPADARTLRAARIDTRPLVVGRTKAGDVIGASTAEAIWAAARTCGIDVGKMHVLPEGAVITVEAGEITAALNIGTGSGEAESVAEYAGASDHAPAKPREKGKSRPRPRVLNQNEKVSTRVDIGR